MTAAIIEFPQDRAQHGHEPPASDDVTIDGNTVRAIDQRLTLDEVRAILAPARAALAHAQPSGTRKPRR